MQPYFFPYIGYFQLMNAVDEFVIYDNIQFAKKGWVNRNRILVNGKDEYITVPLKKDSDYLNIVDRQLAASWDSDKKKILSRIKESYRKAPFFNEIFQFIEELFSFEAKNLFDFLFYALEGTKSKLGIATPLIVSSNIPINHTLKAQDKVLEIVNARNGNIYINPIGGTELYDKNTCQTKGIDLQFLKANEISYLQFKNVFVPFLSIIDIMMFNSKEKIDLLLLDYTLH